MYSVKTPDGCVIKFGSLRTAIDYAKEYTIQNVRSYAVVLVYHGWKAHEIMRFERGEYTCLNG